MQPVNGQNLGTYLVRSGGHTWADLDSYVAFMAKGNVEFNKTVAPFLESVTSAISRNDIAHQNVFPNPNEVHLYSVGTYHLKPDKIADMTKVIDKYHLAVTANKYPAYYGFIWSVNGIVGQTVSIVTPLRNWADMKGPEERLVPFLNRVLGTLEAQRMGNSSTGRMNGWRVRSIRFAGICRSCRINHPPSRKAMCITGGGLLPQPGGRICKKCACHHRGRKCDAGQRNNCEGA